MLYYPYNKKHNKILEIAFQTIFWHNINFRIELLVYKYFCSQYDTTENVRVSIQINFLRAKTKESFNQLAKKRLQNPQHILQRVKEIYKSCNNIHIEKHSIMR